MESALLSKDEDEYSMDIRTAKPECYDTETFHIAQYYAITPTHNFFTSSVTHFTLHITHYVITHFTTIKR